MSLVTPRYCSLVTPRYCRQSAIPIGIGRVLWVGAVADPHGPISRVFFGLDPNRGGAEWSIDRVLRALIARLHAGPTEIRVPFLDRFLRGFEVIELDADCAGRLAERLRALALCEGESP